MQTAVTLTLATPKAEKKNKDTIGGAIERVPNAISYPKARWEGSSGTRQSNASFEGLMRSWAHPMMRIPVSG